MTHHRCGFLYLQNPKSPPSAAFMPAYQPERHQASLEKSLPTSDAPLRSGDQLSDRLTKGENRHGPALVIQKALFVVDPEKSIDGGPQIVWR